MTVFVPNKPSFELCDLISIPLIIFFYHLMDKPLKCQTQAVRLTRTMAPTDPTLSGRDIYCKKLIFL